MVSNMHNEKMPIKFLEFFSKNRALAIEKIENLLINSAKVTIDSLTNKKMTNVVIFEFMDEMKHDLQDLWQENVLTEIELAYRSQFKRGIPNKAIELSYSNFQKGLDRAYDQVSKQVLRWPLDLTSEDLFKLTHLIIQNIKNSVRKSILVIQDNTVSSTDLDINV